MSPKAVKSKPTAKKKVVASKSAKATKAVVRPSKAEKAPKSAQNSPFLAQWLQDASLEVMRPLQAYAPGERQLEMSVRAREISLPQPNHLRLELRLRAHIHVRQETLVVAEIAYASVVENAQSIPELLQQLYPHARDALANLLQLSGHTPPLPESLTPNKA